MRLQIRLLTSTMILSLLLIGALSALAQDAPPTPFIPVATSDGSPDDDSAAPTLDAIAPTPIATAETTPEATVEGAEQTPIATEDIAAPESVPLDNQSDQCPIQVQEAFTATELICTDLTPGQACIGNGLAQAQPRTTTDGFAFSQPSDRAAFSNLETLTLQTASNPSNVWAVMDAQAQFTTRDSATTANATLIAFGDVSLANTGDTFDPNFITGTVLAQQGMNVRRTPDERGVVVYQLEPQQEIVVTGRTADEQWIRMEIPSAFGGIGWVYAPYIGVPGGIGTLGIVDVNSPAPQLEAPEFGPMQAFTLQSTRYPDCEDTPDSGLMIQSASGLADALLIRINNVRIELNGTMFVQAQPDTGMEIDVLEGEAAITANDSDVNATAGNAVRIGLSAEMTPNSAPSLFAYDEAGVMPLPISLLSRPFEIAAPSGEAAPPPVIDTGEGTVESPDETTTEDTSTEDTGEAPAAGTCTITAVDAPKNIRSGPGVSFGTVGTLAANSSATATGQANDSFNFTWYQIEEGWIRFDTVQSAGDCANLPTVDAPDPQSTMTPTATEEAAAISLSSSELGDVCAAGSVSGSTISTGEDFSVEVGGTWQATAGTIISISTSGGMMRGEYGDYIRITDSNDTILAQSGDGRTLNYTFANDATFTLGFSAANGDTVEATVFCTE